MTLPNVETSMIWGTQYDQVMNWLIKTGEKTPLDINKGSVAGGNYIDVEFEYYTNTSKTIGEFKDNCVKSFLILHSYL